MLPSKPRRKRPPEALDWRELAQGPALRGLAEILATPPNIAKERAENRTRIEYRGQVPTEGDTPTEGVTVSSGTVESPTVGDTPTAFSASEACWLDAEGNRYKPHRVQRVAGAQQSMALGEERVYQALWHANENDGVFFESKKTKTFSLGYDRIARLVRLNEKSVRILLPKLIGKKILEVVAAENSATRTGRTYRIFSYENILERQEAAKLQYIAKNGRAVEFVQIQHNGV